MPRKDDSFDRLVDKIDSLKEHIDGHLGGMKDRLDTVDRKLETMDGRLDSLDVTSGQQKVILDDHVRRTTLLEEKLEVQKKEIDEKIKPLESESIKTKIMFRVGIGLLGLGGLGGAGLGIQKIIVAIFGGGEGH